jgi:hypothetical protein
LDTGWSNPAGGGATEVWTGIDPPATRKDEVLWIDTDAVAPAGVVPVVTALPTATAQDGDEVYYRAADDYGPVMWRFRYDAGASRMPWEFVGGSPITNYVANRDTLPNATSSGVDLANVGPVINVPFAGDYLFGFTMTIDGTPSAAASVSSSPIFSSTPSSQKSNNINVQLAASVTVGLVAGQPAAFAYGAKAASTMTLRYTNLNKVTGLFISVRSMSLIPLRCA